MADEQIGSSRSSLDASPASDGRCPLNRADSEFVRELFELHRLGLYRYLKHVLVSREDAQEALQETYLRFLSQPQLYRMREKARAYLFQTAANLARDTFRRRIAKSSETEAEMFAASGLDAPDWNSWPDLALEGEQLRALLIAALAELQPEVRTALLLHRFHDLTHQAIANRLRTSERTIQRYVKEGMDHIVRKLDMDYSEEET